MDIRVFEEVIEEIYNEYKPGSDYWIKITNVTTPQDFYVRPTKYNSYLELLESQIKTEVNVEPKINDLVAYRAQKRGGKTMRGRVVGLNETELSTTFCIFALDYGYLDEEIEMIDIFSGNDNLFDVPPLAFHCQLHLCAPVGKEWSEDSIEAFKYYLANERAKMIVIHKKQNKLIIELYNTCPDHLAMLLSLTGYSSWGYLQPNSREILAEPTAVTQNRVRRCKYFNYKVIPLEQILHVCMLYFKTLEEFYVAEVKEYEEYEKILEEITRHALDEREIREEELVVGRPVLVKEEKPVKYGQRGIIENILISESKVSICLVDCGKRMLAEKVSIKNIPMSLCEQPVRTIYCRTQELCKGITMSEFSRQGFKFTIIVKAAGSELKIPNTVKTNRV